MNMTDLRAHDSFWTVRRPETNAGGWNSSTPSTSTS